MCPKCGKGDDTAGCLCPDCQVAKDRETAEMLNASLSGWKCPGCGRCYSPYVAQCAFCLPMLRKDANGSVIR
ncbi:MAG: hypothetical protein IMZ61_03185 [Planctomycetes bacterium]|nr:hypothetical protein [Planctomycetota bacterium]